MFHNIIILLILLILVFYYSTRLKEGFSTEIPASLNALTESSSKKYNPVTNTLNLLNPQISLTNENAAAVKAALNTPDMIPTSGGYNVTSGRPKYDIPNSTSPTFMTVKQCEKAPPSCAAFNDPTFSENCGISFDMEGTNSEGKAYTGGLFISSDSRTDQMSQSMKARDERRDPYQVFQPTVGTAKPGTFALTKDDCIIVKERMDCDSKQTFDSPNCTQCYTSGTFSRVGPEVTRIPFAIILTGKCSFQIKSSNPAIDKGTNTYKLDDNSPTYELAIPGDSEGSQFTIVTIPENTTQTIGGLIGGKTASGAFFMDINHIVQADQETGAKPRISGSFKLKGYNVVRMVPGTGKKGMKISCLIPFSFIDTDDYQTGGCNNGPIITQANSAIFLNSDACFNKKNKPGDYSLECLQSRWMSLGGTIKGTGYPSTKELADALQKNPDGSPRTIESIMDSLSVIMLQAQTGKAENGQQLSIDDWNKASLFATGKTISSPCDVENADTGPLSQECLSYLYMNQGSNTSVGPTYDLPSWSNASNVGQKQRNTYCQPGTSMDPNTPEGLKLGQSLGGVDQVKAYYNRVNRIANDNSLSNTDRESQVKQCYGVSLNPVVDNATPGPAQVFAVGPGYDFTRDQAAGVCAGYGAQVATKAQLAEAQTKGADWCFSGWVQDSPNGQWPITTSVIGGCGGRQGIIEWTPDSKKAGVNCYGPKPAIQSVSQGVIKPFNGTNWDQPSAPGYTEVPSGYLQTTGEQPACFNGLTPEQAKEGCDRLGNRCAGISYSKDGSGSGCYKGNQLGGLVADANYMGFVKTPIPAGSGLITGRYIKLQYNRVECLNLAEIRVYSSRGGPNIITPNTVVTKNSGYQGDMFPNSNFVDGNLSNFVHTSCYDIPWIEVDLGRMVEIYKVNIYNRVDCCAERVLGAVLQIRKENNDMIYTSEPITTNNRTYTWLPPNRAVIVDRPDD
jgi:Extracellular link domain